MKPNTDRTYIAFLDTTRVATGDVFEVARKVKHQLHERPKATVLVFDEFDSSPLEIDFRGSEDAVLKRLMIWKPDAEKPTGPGRPKLGVVSKEVGLLPRHWEWLSRQPGGASATLRKLVETAQKQNRKIDLLRQAQESAYKFMTVMAGELPLYEEALRALYANDKVLFETLVAPWPKDIRRHVSVLASKAFEGAGEKKIG